MSITFANRERMRDRARHQDLLDQVADNRAEADAVRHILGTELQRRTSALPKLTEADLDAHQAERMLLGGDAAFRADYARWESGQFPAPEEAQRPPSRRGDAFIVVALLLASCIAVASVLGILSWGAF